MRKINNKLPTLVNLNEDPQLSEVLIYIIREGGFLQIVTVSFHKATQSHSAFFQFKFLCFSIPPSFLGDTSVGSAEDSVVQLAGALVLPQHCILHCERDGDSHKVDMTALPEALIYVNGHEVAPERRELHHGDRVIIGNHHFFRVNIPRPRLC